MEYDILLVSSITLLKGSFVDLHSDKYGKNKAKVMEVNGK
jgi:hypothetical protein